MSESDNETRAAATELARITEKWDGLELNFAVRATANNLVIPLEVAQAGLRVALTSNLVHIVSEGSEENLLVAN